MANQETARSLEKVSGWLKASRDEMWKLVRGALNYHNTRLAENGDVLFDNANEVDSLVRVANERVDRCIAILNGEVSRDG